MVQQPLIPEHLEPLVDGHAVPAPEQQIGGRPAEGDIALRVPELEGDPVGAEVHEPLPLDVGGMEVDAAVHVGEPLAPAWYIMMYGALGLALIWPMTETNARRLDE